MRAGFWGGRLVKTARRCIFYAGAFAMLCVLWNYIVEMRLRLKMVPACEWSSVTSPNSEKSIYSARYCWLKKDIIFLQVLENSRTVVANRTYSYPDIPNFYWEAGGLGYIDDSDGAFISLPPSFTERFRTALP